MERDVVIEPLQKRFRIAVKDANRQRRNRSFANASDCCGVKLRQEKFCSSCNGKVGYGECKRKLVKIGKEEHLVDAAALQQATDALEGMEDIKLDSFLSRRPTGAEDRFDALIYAYPAKKHEAAYAELAAVLEGRTAVGTAVFRGNEFQVLVEVGDDGRVRVRKLVEEEQRYELQEIAKVAVNGQIVELERKILDKATVEDVDLSVFKDRRSEIEERIIEDVVLNGKAMPDVKKDVAKEKESDELARLKALAGE